MNERAKAISKYKRAQVSKENKKEYDNEKRVKELTRRGYNEAAVAGMMQISEKEVRNMRDHKTNAIFCDGEL